MTDIIFKITGTDSQPIQGATIDIALPEVASELETLVLPTSVKGVTNNNGEFQTVLAPAINVSYYAVVFDPNTRRKGIYEFIVPDVPTTPEEPADIADLVLLPPPTTTSYDAVSIAAIADNRVRAELAADQAAGHNNPRYDITPASLELIFADVSGTQTAYITAAEGNGFRVVNEQEGVIVIPDETEILPIGTAVEFVKGTTFNTIDIEFVPATASVTVDNFATTASGAKLRLKSDVFVAVKTGTNHWKVYNKGGSGGGTNFDEDFENIEGTTDALDVRVVALEGWRAAFNTQLNNLTGNVNNHTVSISSLLNTISGLTLAIANINQDLNERITLAIPGLGDLTSFVNDAETAADSAEQDRVLAQNAVIAAQAAADSATSESQDAQDAAAAIDAVVFVTIDTVSDLRAVDFNTYTNAVTNGETSVGDGEHRQYYYDAGSIDPDNSPLVIKPTVVTGAGRWLAVPALGSSQIALDAIITNRILNENVTNPKLANMSAYTFKVNNTGDPNSPTDENAATVRDMLNVEDGATADQTGAEIASALFAESSTNNFDNTYKSKLEGIESNATADQTGAEIALALFAESSTNNFDNTYKSKLEGIEANATADQSNAEIETAYNAQVAAGTEAEITGGSPPTADRRYSPSILQAAINSLISSSLNFPAPIAGTVMKQKSFYLVEANFNLDQPGPGFIPYPVTYANTGLFRHVNNFVALKTGVITLKLDNITGNAGTAEINIYQIDPPSISGTGGVLFNTYSIGSTADLAVIAGRTYWVDLIDISSNGGEPDIAVFEIWAGNNTIVPVVN